MLTSQIVDELNDLFAEEFGLTTSNKSELKNKGWHCPIHIVRLSEYIVMPLTSSRRIKSEGYLMQNCVRGYVDQCRNGEYLLFSIRNLGGKRIATLGVNKRGDRWYFDECLGKENSAVIEVAREDFDADHNMCLEIEYTELFSVAHEVVRLLNLQTEEI